MYGPKSPPTWLCILPLQVHFSTTITRRFRNGPVHFGTTSLALNVAKDKLADAGAEASFTLQPMGQWDWPLTLNPETPIE
ncbi:hypothetical protein [Bradyrhizobium icense]|uniref:Uncharacterized protein n=1 Tax=Bradyrhizobium icense TaxID=1274631 RepID=A0A1B1UKC3_9BRAD|nr:hypothetical protein [Bradyrhizobium icense]ANW03198.1 hypothetical protein LMTR13_26740 [Bradyrhizobium icense]